MKKKKLIIFIAIFIIALIVVVAVSVSSKISTNTVLEENEIAEYFEVTETSGLKFKGSSVISDEQKIFLDQTKGTVNEVFVKDGQSVEKDTVLFNYYNEAIQDQVDDLNRQIESLNTKINSESEKAKKIEELQKKAKEQEEKRKAEVAAIAKKNNINNEEVLVTDENSAMSEIESISSSSVIDELKYSLNDLVAQRDALSAKVVTEVKAEIPGKVYIYDENSTAEYMRIVSNEPLILAEATEYDINEIKLDSVVNIKVITENREIKGTITKIEDLPTTSLEQKSSLYKFYIKPEESVKIGFSVEITVNPGEIIIPNEAVTERDGKLYVTLLQDDANKEVEISAILKDNNYIIQNDSLKIGDKILLNSSEDNKEEI